MNHYKILKQQVFSLGDYSLVPIRREDRYEIMKWRNEQIYHLRQTKLLTKEEQDKYFDTIIAKLFDDENPDQLLFSYLQRNKCIGYGGLVHINWTDKNAEVSFIMDTKLEKEEFHKHWGIYLELLFQIAFEQLKLHKIYTYAFDVRPQLYEAIEAKGFVREAILKEHCLFNNKYIDIIIHSVLNHKITLRKITADDKIRTFEWANDEQTRINSFNSKLISFEEHSAWFDNKLTDEKALYFIGEINNYPIGLLRFDIENDKVITGIVIDKELRGKKLASEFLRIGCETISKLTGNPIVAFIKKDNIPSIKSFEKAGFIFSSSIKINNIDSYEYVYRQNQ
jgi:RimJ/RimL family protein N-acetyltransferase